MYKGLKVVADSEHVGEFFRVTEYSCSVRYGVSSSHSTLIGVATDRPEAVVRGPTAVTHDERDRARDYVAETKEFTLKVDFAKLGGGYVALVFRNDFHSCGIREWHEIVLLAGDLPAGNWGEYGWVFREWAQSHFNEARDYVARLVTGLSAKVKKAFKYAFVYPGSGGAWGKRQPALRQVLFALGLKRGQVGTLSAAKMTFAAKTALSLGWKPSDPTPVRWEGLRLPEMVEIAVSTEIPVPEPVQAAEQEVSVLRDEVATEWFEPEEGAGE